MEVSLVTRRRKHGLWTKTFAASIPKASQRLPKSSCSSTKIWPKARRCSSGWPRHFGLRKGHDFQDLVANADGEPPMSHRKKTTSVSTQAALSEQRCSKSTQVGFRVGWHKLYWTNFTRVIMPVERSVQVQRTWSCS